MQPTVDRARCAVRNFRFSKPMPRASTTCLRLLGAFAVEVNVGRPIAVALRSKKARALIAYLAMKPDWRASREELATLLWGDTPDAQARHSLRQCLLSLRQDLHLAPDLFDLGRDSVELRAETLTVDARELATLATAGGTSELDRAAELWRGAFLADLTLDLEDFDAWREREQERIAGVAARIFEAQCAAADAAGDGERALAAAERLVALDPTREDRQRVALKMIARHRGRDAALDRARQVTALLRTELAVSPDAATRALVEEIRKGDIEPAAVLLTSPRRGEVDARSASGEGRSDSQLKLIEPLTPALSPPGRGSAGTELVAKKSAAPPALPARLPIWRRRPIAAAAAMLSFLSIAVLGALQLATGAPVGWMTAHRNASPQPWLASAIVLPFAVDAERDARDPDFARLLTHELTAQLARFGELRLVSDRTADLYRDRDVDVASLGSELDVRYAIVGRVRQSESGARASVQLVDTATRATLWSETVRREAGEPAQLADEMARGLTRMLDIHMVYAEARKLRRDPNRPAELRELLLRARVAEMHTYLRENVASATRLYEEALQRAPHNSTAMLGVARMNIIAAMNFLDPDTPPDLKRAESMLTEVLQRNPNWALAHYTLGLLQKHRRQTKASLQSFRRAVELSPTFLGAQGQVGILLTRMGQPEKGLETIRAALRVATPNDPGNGFLYLFAAEAELELGHQQAALDWALRAGSFMPGSALAQAWIASIYADMGDRTNAAKYVAASKTISPAYAQRIADRKPLPGVPPRTWPRTRLLEGLRVAFAGPLG
jgi:DNA-binding SARP family transcriptional activator/TolB-like protein/cytochrome c-type biogenesis protein CcmH/NrfG